MKYSEYKEAMKTPYNRKELINLIYVYSGDEFENIEDVWDLATNTDSQLASKVEDIFAYCNSFEGWVSKVQVETNYNDKELKSFEEYYKNLLSHEDNLKNFVEWLHNQK